VEHRPCARQVGRCARDRGSGRSTLAARGGRAPKSARWRLDSDVSCRGVKLSDLRAAATSAVPRRLEVRCSAGPFGRALGRTWFAPRDRPRVEQRKEQRNHFNHGRKP